MSQENSPDATYRGIKPKSFRDFDTLTLARMVYCAIDSPSSVLAERVLKAAELKHDACGCEKCHPEIHSTPVWGNSGGI